MNDAIMYAIETLEQAGKRFATEYAAQLEKLRAGIIELDTSDSIDNKYDYSNQDETETYTFYTTMQGNKIVLDYWRSVLDEYASNMPNGKFWNQYTNAVVSNCLGIAMLANGVVVALNSYCTLKVLSICKNPDIAASRKNYSVLLSPYSIGGVFKVLDNDPSFAASVRDYNEKLPKYCGNVSIVAWIKFKK